MAIYHLSVKNISHKQGRSACAALAYRFGEIIESDYTGEKYDYTAKHFVEHTEIMLSKNAPDSYKDISAFANALDASDTSKGGTQRIAREIEIAMPIELNKEQQIALARQYLQTECVDKGMVVAWALHNPAQRDDLGRYLDKSGNPTDDPSEYVFSNPHIHAVISVKPLNEDGTWQKISQVAYICKNKHGEERDFTPDELKTVDGWEKQYQYRMDKKKIWLSKSEGEEKGLERVSRSPKTLRNGRENPICKKWNSREQVKIWRKQWEAACNEKLQEAGCVERIDSRSYADQGRLDEMPTVHQGKDITAIERRADRYEKEGKDAVNIRTDIGKMNMEIKQYNFLLRQFKKGIEKVAIKAKDTVERIAIKMEGIRAKLIGRIYQHEVLSEKYNLLSLNVANNKARLDTFLSEYNRVCIQNEEDRTVMDNLKRQLNSCGLLQKKRINNEMEKIEKDIRIRMEYLRKLMSKYGIQNTSEIESLRRLTDVNNSKLERIKQSISDATSDQEKLMYSYKKMHKGIDESERDMVEKIQEENRATIEKSTEEKLKTLADYSQEKFEKAVKKADNRLEQFVNEQHKEYHKRISR